MDTYQHSEHLVQRFHDVDSSVVVAGHYCLAEDMQDLSHEGVEEASSFQLGSKLVAATLNNGGQSRLILWVNDIGIPPARRSEVKQNYSLPANYQAIIDAERIPHQNLIVCFESTMRNKASTLLRKIYKRKPQLLLKTSSARPDLVRCVGDGSCSIAGQGKMAYTITGPVGEQLVVKDGPNPKCNLILASLFKELSEKYRPHIHINIFNELYSYRIGLGVHVFRALLENHTPIFNIFCDGSRYIAQEIEVEARKECQSSAVCQSNQEVYP